MRQTANRKSFSNLWIARLKPDPKRQVTIWDTGQVGLGLLVSPGGTKTFRSRYKLHGRWVDTSIGRFGQVTQDQGENGNVAWARERVRQDRIKAKAGSDPRAVAQQEAPDTYGAVVDRFIEVYCKPRQRAWDQTQRALKINCKAWLKKPINDITARDAHDLLDLLVAQGKHATAAVTQARLKSFWTWCFRRDIVPAPLMDKVQVETIKRTRSAVYSPDEIVAAWNAANKLDPVAGAYFKLLILLCPRKTALAAMRWCDLDADLAVWTTPPEYVKQSKKAAEEKGRTYVTPLPDLARRILLGLPRTSPRVFADFRPDETALRKLVRHGGPTGTFHRWRHTIGTALQDKVSVEDVASVLNHTPTGSVTAGYQHGQALTRKREVLEAWARYVAGLVEPAQGVVLLR